MNKKITQWLKRTTRTVVLMSTLFAAKDATAQTAAQYIMSASNATYDTLVAGTTVAAVQADDASSAQFNIGFNFVFAGVTYTQVKANSNGWLSFTNTSPTASQMRTNSATNSTNIGPGVMPLWDDLYGSTASTGSYLTTGAAGSRVFTFEWKKWVWWYSTTSPPTISFQVKLYEGTNIIEFNYKQESTALGGSESATIGIATSSTDYLNLNGTGATPVASSSTFTTNLASKPANGQRYTFTPPAACSGIPTAGIVSPASINQCSGYPVTLTATGYSIATGITLQWQSSPDNITYTDIAGATSATYTSPAISSATFFRLKVVCNATGQATTVPVPVTVFTPTATPASIPYTESFETWVNNCYTTDRPGLNWLTTPATSDSAWRRNDQGASAGWTSTLGGFSPTFSAGAFSARFHSYDVAATRQGSMILLADLSGAGSKSISFDYINTSGTDTLFVEVSTDGGANWIVLGNKTTASSWSPSSFVTNAVAANAMIRFRAKSDYGTTDIGMDNLSVTLNTCPAPTAPAATLVNATGATLGWTSAGTLWQVEYGTGAFGTGTRVISGTNPLVLSTLVPGSAYRFYVRRICGAGDTSSWTAAVNFTTPLNCATATVITACGASQTFANSGSGIYDPVVMPSGNGPYSTPGREMVYRFTAPTTGVYRLNVSAVTTSGYVDYFYKPATGSCENTGWTFIKDRNAVANTDTFSLTAGTTYFLLLDPETTGAVGQTFSLICPPTCFTPTALTATAITATGATLGWTPAGSASPLYQVQYGSSTFTLGTGTNAYPTSNSQVLNTLTAATSYSFYVRAICSAGDTSAWSSRFEFNTACINAALPFSENFVTAYPTTVCWSEATGSFGAGTTTLTGTSSVWTSDTWLNGTGNNAAKINIYNNTTTAIRDWMITPTIDFGTGGRKVLEFNLGMLRWNTTTVDTIGSDDTVAVVISTNNGASWSMANAVKVFTAANPPSGANGSERYYIPLNGYSGLVKIGFYGSQGNVADTKDIDVFVDSILVTNCTVPTVALGNDTTICPGKTMTLNSGTGSEYLWSNGATTQSLNITTAGTYWVKTVNGSKGCFNTDTIVVAAGVNPVVALGNDTTVCPGASMTFNAGNAGSTYVWNNATTAQTLNVTAAGTYFVTVKNAAACTAADTVVVNNGIVPAPALGPNVTVCSGIVITLDAGPGSSYLWNNGVTTQVISVDTSGTFSVVVTSSTGCTGTDTVAVTVLPLTTVSTITPVITMPSVAFTSDAANATNYAWDFGDGATDLTASPTHVYTANGTYNVRVIAINACNSDTAFTTVTITGVGINTPLAANAIKLYPNPAVNNVMLESTSVAMSSYSLFNNVGALVKEDRITNAHKVSIDLSAMPSGVYQLRIKTADGIVNYKVQIIK